MSAVGTESTQDVPDAALLEERADAGRGYVQRTLLALDYLAGRSAGATELAAALDVHRRTATRLIDVMTAAGWIEPDPEDPRQVRLTTKIITVAGAVLRRSSLVQTAAPFVRALRDRLDESAHFAVPSRGAAIQVVESISSQPLAVSIRMGERVPIHCSAIGKAFAAHLPEQADAAVAAGLTRYTPRTKTTREEFERELDAVRRQGHAVDDEELYLGTRCIAAPVRAADGEVVASIGISGPAVRVTPERVDDYARVVRGVAAGLSAALGYAPSGEESSAG